MTKLEKFLLNDLEYEKLTNPHKINKNTNKEVQLSCKSD